MRLAGVIALVTLVAACAGREDAGDATGEVEAPEHGVRYERRFWFVSAAPGVEPVTAVFDLEVVDEGRSVRRGAWAWLGRGAEWQPLLDTVWRMAPIREPWRLMPLRSLRLLVDAGGEVEALVHGTGPDEVRLLPGPPLDAWVSPDAELVYSTAELRVAGLTYSGALLDARVGARQGRPPLRADAARPAQVFVTDGAGAVFALSTDVAPHGTQAWVREADGAVTTWPATLTRVPLDDVDASGEGHQWIIRAGDDHTIRAELRAVAAHSPTVRRFPGTVPPLFVVAGRALVGDEPREVVGFVREGSH